MLSLKDSSLGVYSVLSRLYISLVMLALRSEFLC